MLYLLPLVNTLNKQLTAIFVLTNKQMYCSWLVNKLDLTVKCYQSFYSVPFFFYFIFFVSLMVIYIFLQPDDISGGDIEDEEHNTQWLSNEEVHFVGYSLIKDMFACYANVL